MRIRKKKGKVRGWFALKTQITVLKLISSLKEKNENNSLVAPQNNQIIFRNGLDIQK